MCEHHSMVGEARGEPLPSGQVGIRLRVRLSGSPSARWSRDLSARLAKELTGEPAIGHVSLNNVVHGCDIVLDGVEEPTVANLAGPLRRAVDATNTVCEKRDRRAGRNMPPDRADAIAQQVRINDRH